MQTLKLKFNKAAVALIDDQPGQSITLLDALAGQLGTVVDIEVILNVAGVQRPAIPFIDQSKITDSTPAPMAAQNGAKAQTAAEPEPEDAAAAPAKANGRGRKGNKPVVHKITKDTKIAIMMQALTKKSRNGNPVGITRSDLAAAMGQVENSPTAYLYSYPKKFGCTLQSEVRRDNLRYYWVDVPDNVTFEYV